MSEKEITECDIVDYPHAVKYAWITYLSRNLPYILNKMMNSQQEGTKGGNTFNMNWSQLNPILQAKRKIPEKFLQSLNDE
jgi:hypothetical protein